MKTTPAIMFGLAALASLAFSSCETTGDPGDLRDFRDPRMLSTTEVRFGDGSYMGGWEGAELPKEYWDQKRAAAAAMDSGSPAETGDVK